MPPKVNYRERADECEKIAARDTSSPHIREVVLFIASRWRRLADWNDAKEK